MKRAAAIVTNRGGRTCHAAIIARELGIPGGRRLRRRDARAGRRRAGHRVLRRGRHRSRLRRAARGRGRRGGARPDAAVAHQDHDERRQSGARLRVPPAAERRRRARAARVHHQQATSASIRRRCSSSTASRPSCSARSASASRGYASPTEFYVEQDRRRCRHDRRGVLAEEGDRAPVGLQVERVLEPRRRPALRAARGESDARASAARRATSRRSSTTASRSSARR